MAVQVGASGPVAVGGELVVLVAGLDGVDESSVGWDAEGGIFVKVEVVDAGDTAADTVVEAGGTCGITLDAV